jgi:hypothetical protein
MSLFLQTLVLRGILFREQEHRQERIGVGMTPWPTGPTTGEEANEIEIGNLHESGAAHSGLHVTGGNRNGYSRGAKCSCRQFGRSAKSDSSRLRRVG